MVNEKLKRLYEILDKASIYRHALGLLNFDFETAVPRDAKEKESDVINFFSNELFKIENSDEFKEIIVYLHSHIEEVEDPLDKVLINKKYKTYLKRKNMSEEFALEMDKIYSKAFIDWYNAREKSDYSLFKDSFKSVIEIGEREVKLRENVLPNLYDNFLNDCEEGMLQEDLDKFFSELKEGLLSVLHKIQNSKHTIRTDFLSREVPSHKQEEFGRYILELNGYDFNRGGLTTTEHPFTIDIAKDDARVTTHYYKDMVLSSMYSCIHEGGHGIFMQNEDEEDFKHYINDTITNGMHESVSRFYENVIGRSEEYCHLIYPKFKEIFSPIFDDVTEREFYEGINYVSPSLIRTEADEVTYGLHVIIRYEMEKKICKKEISLDEIPTMWNKLYKEYLGVDVPDDRNGVLQDVHWTSSFGYFPSYALGNAYNQMYLKKMREEFSLEEEISKGNFEKIKDWLKENVFKKANRLSPKEWIVEVSGESITPKYFIEYLNKKYGDIYKF